MSFYDWLFGDDSPPQQTATQHTSSEIPDYIAKPSERLIQASEKVAGTPFTPYTGERIAGFNEDQLSAMQRAREGFGTGTERADISFMQSAGSGRDITGDEIAQYMNPYQTQVADYAADEMTRRSEMQSTQNAAAATKAGAFGGDRYGIMEAERLRNLDTGIGKLYADTLAKGYDNTMDWLGAQRERERDAGLIGSQVAQTGQTLQMQDVNQELGIGALQQDQEQRQMDIDYGNYLEQREYPKTQLGFMSNIIKGQPMSTRTSTTTNTPGPKEPGFFQTAAGLGIAGLSALGNVGWSIK